MNNWKKKLLDEGTIHLELFVTRKCNIKCKNCMFYCNINKSEEDVLYPLEQLEKELKNTPESDIKRIGYLKAKIALINKKKRSFE